MGVAGLTSEKVFVRRRLQWVQKALSIGRLKQGELDLVVKGSLAS